MTEGRPFKALDVDGPVGPSGELVGAGRGATGAASDPTSPHVGQPSGGAVAVVRHWPARFAAPALLLMTAGLWAVLYRYWMVQGDDFRFTGFRGEPHATFRADQWWALVRYDYLKRTGRTSDSIGRLLLRPGHWFFPAVAVVVVTVLGWAAARWLETGRARSAATLVVGVSALPVVLLCRPALNGDAVFWEMSFVNYVLPGLGAVFSLGTLARALSGRRVAMPTLVAAMVAGLLTGTTHEVFAVGFVVVVLLTLLVGRRQLTVRVLLLLASLAVGAGILLGSPGFWVRVGQNSGTAASGEGGMVLRAHKLMMGSVHEFEVARWQLCLGAFALAALAWRRGTRHDRVAAGVLALLTAALPVVAWRWVRVTAPLQGLDHRISDGELAVGGVFVTAFVLVLLLSLRLVRPRGGVLPHGSWPAFLAVAMAAGASVPSSMSGVGTPRAYLPAALFLGLLALDALLSLAAASSPARSWHAWPLLLACAVAAGVWWGSSAIAMRANHARMVPVLREFHRGPRAPHTIKVPLTLPHPDWQYQKGFDLAIYRKYIVYWYGMPVNTNLVQQPH